MSRAWVGLVGHGAGHQADPLSTDRRDVLQRASVEDSSEPSAVDEAPGAQRSTTWAAACGCRLIGSADPVAYCLNNWRKHGEDRLGLPSTWLVDPFSSGISFPDWKELQDQAWMWPIRETYDPLMVRRPATWLLSEGWKLAGEISAREVPGPRR